MTPEAAVLLLLLLPGGQLALLLPPRSLCADAAGTAVLGALSSCSVVAANSTASFLPTWNVKKNVIVKLLCKQCCGAGGGRTF